MDSQGLPSKHQGHFPKAGASTEYTSKIVAIQLLRAYPRVVAQPTWRSLRIAQAAVPGLSSVSVILPSAFFQEIRLLALFIVASRSPVDPASRIWCTYHLHSSTAPPPCP